MIGIGDVTGMSDGCISDGEKRETKPFFNPKLKQVLYSLLFSAVLICVSMGGGWLWYTFAGTLWIEASFLVAYWSFAATVVGGLVAIVAGIAALMLPFVVFFSD